jgi:SAM-dependent methyltransferase
MGMKKLMQKIQGLFHHLAIAGVVWQPRSEYKKVWNRLSPTERLAKVFVAGYSDEDQFHRAAEETKNYILEHTALKPDDAVLEIGCGVGRVGAALAPLCKKWIGCDVSGNMLKYARRRLAPFQNVELVEVSGYDLGPIGSESVDVVYATVVFMHLDEWDRYAYVKEAHRVLRPGGRVLIDNVNLCSDEGWAFFEQHRRFAPKRRPANISKTSTPQELETYLRRAGFRDIRVMLNRLWVCAAATK